MTKINKKIADLGEFGLIEHITNKFESKNASTVKAIGDDAAVLDYSNKQQVVTTDLLIENIHFNLNYVPLKHLGYKAVTVNLSDICAMNAVPKQITVSIAISNRFSLEAVEELYEGIKIACDKYNVDLIGGDTSSSTTGLLISVTAFGEVENKNLAFRNTAKENDIVCVTGDLGGAYAGLQILERENKLFLQDSKIQPVLSGYDYTIKRQLKPEARFDVIKIFNALNIIPTSMIDISDGLSSELMHICSKSGVGCRIYEDKLPIDPETDKVAMEINLDSTIFAMNGGEDYELLFTISQDDYKKIEKSSDISTIGFITSKDDGLFIIARDGTPVVIQAQGWNPLK